MALNGKRVLVTGGSRGLGLGIVEAMVDQGATVTVVARDPAALAAVSNRLGVDTIQADITSGLAALRTLAQVQPDILVLNAGAPPPMGPLDRISWDDFTLPWEHDVKAGLHWIQAALNIPLGSSARVVVVSSGAAVAGSPMSGGYAGAKRMLWFMAHYANRVSEQRRLGIVFQTVIPRQMILGTGTGDGAAQAYAGALGITPETFVERFGAPMPPRTFGDHVVSILDDPAYAGGFAFGVSGSGGINQMEDLAA